MGVTNTSTFHLHVPLKEALGHSEQRPASVRLADGRRRQEEFGAGVNLRELTQTCGVRVEGEEREERERREREREGGSE